MGSFPMTRIEDLEISRMIIGTNWFRGFSHYSAAKSRWIREYMDLNRIVAIMNVFARNGCNAVLSGPEPLMQEAIRRVKEETGVTVHWLCTPSGEDVDELMPGIELSAEVGAAVCLPHQHWTDGNMLVNQKRILGLERVTERIRELGMIPGLSTHRPETVVVCDTAGYDVATYIQIYNPVGFLARWRRTGSAASSTRRPSRSSSSSRWRPGAACRLRASPLSMGASSLPIPSASAP